MRSTGRPSLAEAFEWAKVRGDALLGGLLERTPTGPHSIGVHRLLAGAMLAAGLPELPRALRRREAAGGPGRSEAFADQFTAWTGEGAAASAEAVSTPQSQHPLDGHASEGPTGLSASAIASGRADAERIGSFIAGSIGALWGVVPDAQRGAVALAPDGARLGSSAALSRLRVGRTVLDVRYRSTGDLVSIGVRRGAGPPILLDCSLRGEECSGILVDGESVAGSRVRFEVREAHDVQFHLSGQPPLSSPPS